MSGGDLRRCPGCGAAIESGGALHPGQRAESGRALISAFDLLGRRWVLRILWELASGPRGFSALRRACDDLSPDTLSRRLRELEAAGLVSNGKQGWQVSPSGSALRDPLAAVARWSEHWARGLDEPGR